MKILYTVSSVLIVLFVSFPDTLNMIVLIGMNMIGSGGKICSCTCILTFMLLYYFMRNLYSCGQDMIPK